MVFVWDGLRMNLLWFIINKSVPDAGRFAAVFEMVSDDLPMLDVMEVPDGSRCRS